MLCWEAALLAVVCPLLGPQLRPSPSPSPSSPSTAYQQLPCASFTSASPAALSLPPPLPCTQDLLAATLEIPFSVPPYMSLLARSVATLEGIALVGDPNYQMVAQVREPTGVKKGAGERKDRGDRGKGVEWKGEGRGVCQAVYFGQVEEGSAAVLQSVCAGPLSGVRCKARCWNDKAGVRRPFARC